MRCPGAKGTCIVKKCLKILFSLQGEAIGVKLIIKDQYTYTGQMATTEVLVSGIICVGTGCEGQTFTKIALDGKRPESSSVTRLDG